DIHTFYDTSHVLFGVSLVIHKGEVVCILGRNGAGKSTTLLSIVGMRPPSEGKVIFMNQDITSKQTYLIARMGIALVPQERKIFPDLTVRENLLIPFQKGKAGRNIDNVYALFPSLQKIDSRKGGYLSGGEQQMLAIGRAMMTNPILLLLDEAGEGLSPLVLSDLVQGLIKLNEQGTTLVLAEQNINFARRVSKRSYVIEKGEIRFEGGIEELNANEEVKSKYLAV
ncbi:MAG TPA: ABC transporter ATP-binding protein, partial [Desulfosporosinus sp.]|nr:ABC transporter ATP-binding protein [Desulfosporosinus sp.]